MINFRTRPSNNKIDVYEKFVKDFGGIFVKQYSKDKDIIFLCVGTDRVIGDSLGPMVGYKIKNNISKGHVIGTLEDVIVALNIVDIIEKIHREYNNPFIIVIDSCVSNYNRIGDIVVKRGSMKIGEGLNKNLISVGNMHIKGIVANSEELDFMTLQNMRISTIMKMADIISKGLIEMFK